MLICRRLQLGQGKLRLARSLGAAAALAIAQALLECALEDAAAWHGALVIAPDGAADAAWAAALLRRDAIVVPQPPGNLGQRLNAVDAAVRALGHERLLFIGSDSPSLTVPDLLAAASALERSDGVDSGAGRRRHAHGSTPRVAGSCDTPVERGEPRTLARELLSRERILGDAPDCIL